MLGDKKEIQAGDGSTNIQGDKVTVVVNQGLSYTEVRQVSMDVFENNFYDLGEKVKKLVNERAEEILNKYLKRLAEESPESINNTEDPDIRSSIFEVQKSYARLGDKEISDLLVEVLIKRTINPGEPFIKLVLNEALTIIPKLTTKQINILSLIYLVKYLSFIPQFNVSFDTYSQLIQPFLTKIEIPTNEIFYQHLQYCGCVSISIGEANFDTIMIHKFPYLFKNNEDLNPALNLHPHLVHIKSIWNSSKLCNSTLSSVGIAIALNNLKVKAGYDWNLNLWIHE
ncbi:LPO_1073/Vpar_1526 family protein [Desulfosporosinus lacus]|uniref:Uncharacterized protein n=1 Tax=Desulfosporosinus lacus DSM 15449 TaxID=1121420 RepID=A0A1M5QFQ8_9FIRM|nr:LPO_1073/Vpar_1526 family protein [Desulfosporosinus lacus]SHH12892.1 hypothetical protein SAMN02746098_00245 [Desulfosporosinus lacus DSM 15449]